MGSSKILKLGEKLEMEKRVVFPYLSLLCKLEDKVNKYSKGISF